ncbi:hypothetical protein [Fructobacillus fructosus]|uniref:hypothetical protein n=1 Tax=Fructobacillus fructosus TaxID=1631 RepID=UPI0030C83B7C
MLLARCFLRLPLLLLTSIRWLYLVLSFNNLCSSILLLLLLLLLLLTIIVGDLRRICDSSPCLRLVSAILSRIWTRLVLASLLIPTSLMNIATILGRIWTRLVLLGLLIPTSLMNVTTILGSRWSI